MPTCSCGRHRCGLCQFAGAGVFAGQQVGQHLRARRVGHDGSHSGKARFVVLVHGCQISAPWESDGAWSRTSIP